MSPEPASSTNDRPAGLWPLYLIVAIKLIAHFATNHRYNYFRDEFYYIACAKHLDFGYVDHPPFVALVTRLGLMLFGENLFAIRLFPAIAGGAIVLTTGLMARRLGAGRFGQCLAALCVLIGPTFLANHNMVSINVYDQLFWTLGAFVMIRILQDGRSKDWLLFGLIAGIGLETKLSMLFFGFGILAGILFTPERRLLRSRWPWLAGGLALVIFLPNIIWQITHDFPTLEFLSNARGGKNSPISPFEFLVAQILEVHPLNFPIWAIGCGYYLFGKEVRRYRPLGLAFVVVFGLFVYMQAKPYYLAPAFPMLFSAGALAIERAIQERNWNWARPAAIIALGAGGLFFAPYTLPVLEPDAFLKYMEGIGLKPRPSELAHTADLPQHYADQFGWEEKVAATVQVYDQLTADEKRNCVIIGDNYGIAGAIDFYGRSQGLPPARSGHNSYYLWGPGDLPGEVLIAVGLDREDLEAFYDDVQEAAVAECVYCLPGSSRLPVYLCKKPKTTLQEAWPRIKRFV
jgi:hypothetical protein